MERLPILGFVTSKGARCEGGSVSKFVEEHLSVLQGYEIVSTEGTYNELLVGFEDKLQARHLRPGHSGGVVELTANIVDGRCQTVLFFSDPDDHWADSFENRTLIRQCVVQNTELLQNIWGARVWAEGNHECIKLPFGEQTVALISHDGKKDRMLEFVGRNIKTLDRFDRIITTGTTGSRIKSLFPNIGKKVFPFKSGPLGGDCQIANEIIEGRCQHAIFFIDPLNPHPHDVDIQLFIRVCQQLKDVNVNFLVTEKSACRWIKTLRREIKR